MQVLHRALGLIGIRYGRGSRQPDYQRMMYEALDRARGAEAMMREATTLEHFDLARSDLQAAHAQLQQVLRQAKRDRGMTLRPVAETEEIHRRMREFLNGQDPDRPSKSKRGRTG